jgi:Concanavalin A-like lectin/glucanases superfamily
MSTGTDLDEIYLIYDNPLEKKLAEVRNDIARSRFQKPQEDTKLDQGSLAVQSFSYLKVVNQHYNVAVHPLGTLDYFPASEPDYNQCKLILTTDHFGRKMFDDSRIPSSLPNTYGFGQDITLYGEPKLEDGFDRGYGDSTNTQKRQALHFNRTNSPTQWQEYINITDQSLTDPFKSLRVMDNTKMSWLIRVKMDSFADNGSANTQPTLFHKCDDSTKDNGYRINFLGGGDIKWSLSKTNVDYCVQANSADLSIGTDYELGFAWDNAGVTDNDKFKIYVNGTLQTNSTGTQSVIDSSTFDTFIGKRGNGDGGYLQGNIILAKIWTGVALTAAQFSQHFTNKLTIGNIAYGKVATTEYPVPKNA